MKLFSLFRSRRPGPRALGQAFAAGPAPSEGAPPAGRGALSRVARDYPPPAPAEPLCLIGDIHGRLDLLERLLAKIAQEAPQARQIFLGDYIDRGPDSAGVLARLQAHAARPGGRDIHLMGNHEAMLLAFLGAEAPLSGEDLQGDGLRWLRHGGRETLASFGLPGLSPDSSADQIVAARQALRAALGGAGLAWLQGLALSHASGNVLAVHAAADPFLPFDAQPRALLLWGQGADQPSQRLDRGWIVHGHVIAAKPAMAPGRIGIDTGAYRSGKLSAVLLASGAAPRFLQA